jgi:hypothetical protein
VKRLIKIVSYKQLAGNAENAPEKRVAHIISVEIQILITEQIVTKKRGNHKRLVIIHGGTYALHWRERSGSMLRVMGSGRGSLRLLHCKFRNVTKNYKLKTLIEK